MQAKMKSIVIIFVCVLAFFRLPVNGLTLCKPLSKFRVDCNICTCSESGREYSCTDTVCIPVNYKDKYNVAENEEGYMILKPKNNEQYVFDDDNNFDLNNGKARNTREKIPYVDDEISDKREAVPSYLDPDNVVNDEKTFLDEEKDIEEDEERINEVKKKLSDDYVFDDEFNKRDDLENVYRDVIN